MSGGQRRRKEEERKKAAGCSVLSLFSKVGKTSHPPHFLSSSFWQVERGKEGGERTTRGRTGLASSSSLCSEVCVTLKASSSGLLKEDERRPAIGPPGPPDVFRCSQVCRYSQSPCERWEGVR